MSSTAGVESDLSRKVQELERELTEARRSRRPPPRFCASSAITQTDVSRSSTHRQERRDIVRRALQRAVSVRRRAASIMLPSTTTPLKILEDCAAYIRAPNTRAALRAGDPHRGGAQTRTRSIRIHASSLPRRSAGEAASSCQCSGGVPIGVIVVVAPRPDRFRDRDRAAEDLRRPGRHRHRERAAVRGGAGAHATN